MLLKSDEKRPGISKELFSEALIESTKVTLFLMLNGNEDVIS
jgi:hypothetical protein